MDDANARTLDGKQCVYLIRREFGNRDDEVGSRGGVSGLFTEALAELRRRVLARHHEQVMECDHGSSATAPWKPLVEAVKNVATREEP